MHSYEYLKVLMYGIRNRTCLLTNANAPQSVFVFTLLERPSITSVPTDCVVSDSDCRQLATHYSIHGNSAIVAGGSAAPHPITLQLSSAIGAAAAAAEAVFLDLRRWLGNCLAAAPRARIRFVYRYLHLHLCIFAFMYQIFIFMGK